MMIILIKKFDKTCVQFDWIRYNGYENALSCGNSGIKAPGSGVEISVTVNSLKEFKKQKEDIKNIHKNRLESDIKDIEDFKNRHGII